MDVIPATSSNTDSTFNAPDANLILRSSDNINFAVYRIIVRLISAVFKDMLSLPQCPDEESSSRPVIQMFEDAHSLRLLLKLCHPPTVCDVPDLITIMDIKRAAALAHKYDIGFLHRKVEAALLTYSKDGPSLAFAVAWRFGYERMLHAAARRSLHFPDFFKTVADSRDALEYDEVPATAFVHLYRYHVAAKSEFNYILLNSRQHPITWIDPARIGAQFMRRAAVGLDDEATCGCTSEKVWFYEGGGEAVSEWRVHSWWWDYVCTVIVSLRHSECRSQPFSMEELFAEPVLRCAQAALLCSIRHDVGVISRVLKMTEHFLNEEIEAHLNAVGILLCLRLNANIPLRFRFHHA